MSSEASRRRLNDAISSLHRFARSRKLDALHAAEAGVALNLTAYGVLAKIVEHGPIGLSDLAGLAHMAPNALSRQVKLLEDSAYIDRRPHHADGRASVVHATALGEDAHRRLRDANDRLLVRQLRDWSTDELEDLAANIERLVADLRRSGEAAER
jgi:DNA-binding MarR family transcriptional regulator